MGGACGSILQPGSDPASPGSNSGAKTAQPKAVPKLTFAPTKIPECDKFFEKTKKLSDKIVDMTNDLNKETKNVKKSAGPMCGKAPGQEPSMEETSEAFKKNLDEMYVTSGLKAEVESGAAKLEKVDKDACADAAKSKDTSMLNAKWQEALDSLAKVGIYITATPPKFEDFDFEIDKKLEKLVLENPAVKAVYEALQEMLKVLKNICHDIEKMGDDAKQLVGDGKDMVSNANSHADKAGLGMMDKIDAAKKVMENAKVLKTIPDQALALGDNASSTVKDFVGGMTKGKK